MAHSNIILACMDLYKEVFETRSELVNCKTWQCFSLRKKLDRCWESSHGTASKHLFLDIFFHDLKPTCHSLRDLRRGSSLNLPTKISLVFIALPERHLCLFRQDKSLLWLPVSICVTGWHAACTLAPFYMRRCMPAKELFHVAWKRPKHFKIIRENHLRFDLSCFKLKI